MDGREPAAADTEAREPRIGVDDNENLPERCAPIRRRSAGGLTGADGGNFHAPTRKNKTPSRRKGFHSFYRLSMGFAYDLAIAQAAQASQSSLKSASLRKAKPLPDPEGVPCVSSYAWASRCSIHDGEQIARVAGIGCGRVAFWASSYIR